MPDHPESTFAPLWRAWRAAVAFGGHLFLCLLAVLGVYVLEAAIRYLWGDQEPKVFDVVPLKYLFHLIDAGIILVFGACGILEAFKKLRE